MSTLDNSLAVAPRNGGSQKTANLSVALRREGVGNTDGVRLNKVGVVVAKIEFFEKFFQFGCHLISRLWAKSFAKNF